MTENSIFIGKGQENQDLLLKLANRHGLIAGATGTGKTVTLQIMAEGFAKAGVPVFMADVKGDLSGISQSGATHDKLEQRASTIGLSPYEYRSFPTIFWDLFAEKGHPIRVKMEDMGALLLSRLMNLNDTQEGVLNIAFIVARDKKMALIDLSDLRAMLVHLSENSKEYSIKYGNISSASIGAIQRRLLVLQEQGAEQFFGTPELDFSDMLRKKGNEGYVNILTADKLINSPKLYSIFLMWMLTHIYSTFPEVGNPDKPKLVFFFDEAHLLFDDAPKALIEKIEQIVRLIRSKGVGVYFVTQNPLDIPDEILGQLGNRVQHALRAFTPRDQKAVKAAANTFRQNPDFNAAKVIKELGVGEALVSMLDRKAAPTIVERTLIRPPESRLGPATSAERKQVISASPIAGIYEVTENLNSAQEMLAKKRNEQEIREAEEDKEDVTSHSKSSTGRRSRASNRQGYGETLIKTILRAVGGQVARKIIKVLIKSFMK